MDWPARIRERLRDARSVLGAVLTMAALVVSLVVFLTVRGGTDRPTADAASPAVGSPVSSPSDLGLGAAQIDPSSTPSSDPSPSPQATATPTPEPTPEPTPDATAPRLTAKPTAKPTSKPVVDPRPEGTPRTDKASGSFGQTLTVAGIDVVVSPTTRSDTAPGCTSDDPERQGWTEPVSYTLRMTWPKEKDAEEPWFAVGSKPYNVLNFDGPSPFKSGADYIVSTCHRPDDSDKVMVEISPPGSPLVYYRWYFH
jgi:hypothetical protein